MKYAWIERHQKHWPISLQCEVLNVSVSGYQRFKPLTRQSTRTLRDKAAQRRLLLRSIKAIKGARLRSPHKTPLHFNKQKTVGSSCGNAVAIAKS